MNIIKFTALAVTLLLAGCLKDGNNRCDEPYNLCLRFSYIDSRGQDIFDGNINSVYVYLFNGANRFVLSTMLDEQALKDFKGVRLNVDPGTYSVVCWGSSASPSDSFGTDAEDITGFYFSHGASLSAASYYAPAQTELTRLTRSEGGQYEYFNIDVSGNGIREETIEFMESHRRITVQVQNFTDAGLAPDIEITQLYAGYDFLLGTYGGRTSYKKTAEHTENNIARADFYTPFDRIGDDVYLNLYRQTDGGRAYDINIRELLDSNGVDPGLTDPIDITIRFLDGDMQIGLEGWNNSGSKPQW